MHTKQASNLNAIRKKKNRYNVRIHRIKTLLSNIGRETHIYTRIEVRNFNRIDRKKKEVISS